MKGIVALGTVFFYVFLFVFGLWVWVCLPSFLLDSFAWIHSDLYLVGIQKAEKKEQQVHTTAEIQ